MAAFHEARSLWTIELSEPGGEVSPAWTKQTGLKPDDYVFPSRIHDSPHLGPRQRPNPQGLGRGART